MSEVLEQAIRDAALDEQAFRAKLSEDEQAFRAQVQSVISRMIEAGYPPEQIENWRMMRETAWERDVRIRELGRGSEIQRQAERAKRQAFTEATIVPENRNLAERIFQDRLAAGTTFAKRAPTMEAINRVRPLIREFVRQLYPHGVLAPMEGWWETPDDPVITKIGLKEELKDGSDGRGAFLINKGEGVFFVPGSNPVNLWIVRFYGCKVFDVQPGKGIRCRETYILHNAVRDILFWCQEMENGYSEPEPVNREALCELYAEWIWICLFEEGRRTIKNTALRIRRQILAELEAGKVPGELIQAEFPEVLCPTHFRNLLRYWVQYGNPSFTVTEKKEHKTHFFILESKEN
jgi:hypothetical protein